MLDFVPRTMLPRNSRGYASRVTVTEGGGAEDGESI